MRVLRPRRDDRRGFAGIPLRIRPDESLLFQGDAASSTGQECMVSTNKVSNLVLVLLLNRAQHNVNGRFWCQCVGRFDSLSPKPPIYLGRHP